MTGQFAFSFDTGPAAAPPLPPSAGAIHVELPRVSAAAAAAPAPPSETWRSTLALCTDERLEQLLATLHLLNPEDVARAVRYHLQVDGALRVDNARQVLGAIGAWEPPDRSRGTLLRADVSIERCLSEGGVVRQRARWRPFYSAPAIETAWLAVHGFEDGWFEIDEAGFVCLGEAALKLREQGGQQA